MAAKPRRWWARVAGPVLAGSAVLLLALGCGSRPSPQHVAQARQVPPPVVPKTLPPQLPAKVVSVTFHLAGGRSVEYLTPDTIYGFIWGTGLGKPVISTRKMPGPGLAHPAQHRALMRQHGTGNDLDLCYWTDDTWVCPPGDTIPE